MAAISNKLSDAEESVNKLLKERSEHILTNMKKLNEEQEYHVNIGTNSNNHKTLLQGETKSCLIKSSEIVFIFLPAFYLIITSPKNSEKISILKI